MCVPLGVSNHYAWNVQANIWLLKLSFTLWLWKISVVGGMWPFLPWERRTFERVQRSADRWRQAADRRASWRSVAINPPNYARSKIHSALPKPHQSTNTVSGRSRKCLKIQSSPSEKISVEKRVLVYFTSSPWFCLPNRFCRHSPYFWQCYKPPRVPDLFPSLGVSSPFLPLSNSTSFLHTPSHHTWGLYLLSDAGSSLAGR